ncbi:MAG: anaerobic glycerol-3-phosphate dehydrogenase subunit C [Pirellulales bacterium]|nr:anaerobic glycerol-3-phosphate dehydrogenase subunit C [Pirellulales bacterium]
MDQQRERIQDDLRGLISGDVRCDDVYLQLYASDASIYEIKPLGVVRPRSTADVAACVQYAAEKQIPLHARGAGSGVAGAALGSGLVVDFSKYLRRVIYTDGERVRVQPGVVHERLNGHLRHRGRFFGPDPATSATTTIGSMIAVDASGSRWLKYGSTRKHILALQVVLADGHVLEVGREPLEEDGQTGVHPRKRELVRQLASLLKTHADLIRRQQPLRSPNPCGYNLAGVLDDGYLDLARLLVGSEGTLAFVTEALLATQPLPRYTGVALLLFDSLEKASRAVMEILPHQPTACDLMDRRHLSLAREAEVRFDLLVPSTAEAVLLVEQEGSGPMEVRQRLHRLVDQVCERQRLAFGSRQAFDPAETDLFWQLAHKGQPALYRLKGGAKPVAVVEDVIVPPEVLPEFLVRVQNVLKRHQLTASIFCHAGHGELHVQPFLDLADPDNIPKMRRLADDLYQDLFAIGGSLGGEHACGLSRTSFLPQQYGELYQVFHEVKRIFDPAGLLNPGKIVGDDPDLMVRHLRPIVSAQPTTTGDPKNPDAPGLRNLVELQLSWDPAQVADVTRACNGCGECRTQTSDVRMCPIFRAVPAEEASPRAKANLIRGVLTGELDLSSLTSDEFKKVADLCVNCHMCMQECPAQVDIPKLMIEGKGAYVAANGLSFSDRVLTRIDLISALGSLVSPLANWSLKNRQMRWLMEKTTGIAQGRKLPRVDSRSFLRRAARRRLTRPTRRSGHKVAYFVDMYANYHDPQLGRALVAVLEHNGVAVYVPPRQRQAGMTAISVGALDLARRLARHNTAILADAVRQGYHIVATEPGAAVCLTREYPNLIDDDDVRLVAANTSEACSYLWKLHTLGRLQLDLRPVNATLAYHMPCRMKALRIGSPGENLLRLIPGLTVQHLEEGCSGMAGTFGLKRENLRTSLRIGLNLINRLREPVYQAGTTECSTCKMQMEQGTTKPTIHPIKLFAYSYGLMPEVLELLTTPGEDLIVT